MKENYNKTLSEEQRARLRRIRHLALDMDGTIYMENNIFPFTIPTLDALKAAGVGHSFLTNNPTKSVGDYVAKLAKMGIECAWEDMYTTPIATIDYIKKAYPEVKKLFMLGTPSMREQFVEAGFISCEDDPADKPDMLVVAFDTTLVYSRLCRAAWWAKQGVPYIATNPDWVCPTDAETILVDCGSLQKCIEAATGRKPDKVMGKPDPELEHTRVYTDIEMGRRAGAVSVLVLSGETTLETALEAGTADFIVRDLEELGNLILESRK